jgi:hypothetical protein
MPAIERLAQECLESLCDFVARQRTEPPLEQYFAMVNDHIE